MAKAAIADFGLLEAKHRLLPIATNYLPDCCKREWRRCFWGFGINLVNTVSVM